MRNDTVKLRMRLALQHRLNPLHVYCRLAPIIGRPRARAFSSGYEVLYKKIL